VPGTDPGTGTGDLALAVTIPMTTAVATETASVPAASTEGDPGVGPAGPAVGTPGLAAAQPTLSTPAATAVSAPDRPAPGSPAALAEQVLSRVSPLRRGPDGTHVLTLRLHPEDLGPVTLVAEVHRGSLRLELTAAVPAAQEALKQAAGDLRRELADAGFGSAAVDVRSDGDRSHARAGFTGGDGSDRRSTQGGATPADARSGTAFDPRGDRGADGEAVRLRAGGVRAVDVRV
jgi:flagellar hook-length control protein FliK